MLSQMTESGSNCLKNIVDRHVINHKKFIKDNTVLFQREEENNISGNLLLCGGPYWSFILEDSSCRLPCIIIDKAGCLKKLINLHGCFIEITTGYIVVESYWNSNEIETITCVQFSLNAIKVLKTPKITSFEVVPEHWDQRCLVVHTSSPIIVKNIFVFCLVLVMMTDFEGSTSKYLWITLKDSQVAWNTLLIPNREYVLHMTTSLDYFETAIKPLRAILGKNKGIPVFKEVIHHPEFWPTLDAVELPNNTTMSIGSSINQKIFNCQFPSAWWQSVDEALTVKSNPIVTILGEILKITHVSSQDKDGCSLCSKQNLKDLIKEDVPLPDKSSWTNPWDTKFNIDDSLPLPNVDSFEPYGTTFPDKLTKVIVLKDVKSGRIVTLYLKKWSYHHYSSNFTPGVIICAKFLHRRMSAKKIPYFVTCALSSFEILGAVSSIRDVVSSESIKYGFPFIPMEVGSMSWGILDQWSLITVSLKHDVTGGLGSCNSASKLKFIASAVVQIERHSGCPISIIFKDDQVKLLLDIPDGIWVSLSTISRKIPLFYSNKDLDMPSEKDIEQIFFAFCETRNAAKKRFHISCRLLPRKPGEDEVYFCTSIGDADPEHLLNLSKPDLLSELLNKSLKY